MKGVLFLEDDTQIISSPETLYNFLQIRSSQPYWGHIKSLSQQHSNHSTPSNYLMNQMKTDTELRDYCLDRYYDLLHTPITVDSIEYCSRLAFYLNRDSMTKVSTMDHMFSKFPTETNLQYHLCTEDREKPCFKDLCILYDLQVSKALTQFHIAPTSAPISEIVTSPHHNTPQ
jgi:hypothetical protein